SRRARPTWWRWRVPCSTTRAGAGTPRRRSAPRSGVRRNMPVPPQSFGQALPSVGEARTAVRNWADGRAGQVSWSGFAAPRVSTARPADRARTTFRKPMPRPLAVRRHNEIVRRLRAAGSVSVAELAVVFEVSHETIRRDLKLLSDQGHLDVVHGGAARPGMLGSGLVANDSGNAEGRAAIGRAAAQLVPQNGSVLLDGGAVTAAIALELTRRSGLTVCTNSLAHAARLSRVPGMRV